MLTLVLFGSLLFFLVLSVPVGIALGLAVVSTILYDGGLELSYLAQGMTTTLDSFPLMAVPFFILAGELMGKGGISKRLLRAANLFFGKFTGGLALVAIAACMFFAAISGSAPATVAAIGGIIVPEMLDKGYSRKFSAGLIATAGTIGVVIPPSIPMVIYGVATGASISNMFIAGFLPGFLIGGILMGLAYSIARKNGYLGSAQVYTKEERRAIMREARWSLLVPVIVLGGIYGGVFTPTEAAAVAVIYGFVVGMFVYKDLTWRDLPTLLCNAALITATSMIVMGTATTFGRILTIEQIPVRLAEGILSYSSNPVVVIGLINILLLFVGCFMDTLAAIIILAPILWPVAQAVGFDIYHFGMIMVVNLAVGFITPPLGVNLFVTCGIAKMSLEDVVKAIVPWLIAMLAALGLLTAFPCISLWLPSLLK
ncbi:MAG: TRAP transporter large permease [Pyramidobacter sp.]|nr:TRAP transporter large permease [Pyramidobacter sp.]